MVMDIMASGARTCNGTRNRVSGNAMINSDATPRSLDGSENQVGKVLGSYSAGV